MKFLLSLLSLLILSMGISFAHAVDFDDVIAAAQTQIEMNRASAEGRWSAGFAISRVVPIGGDVGKAPAYAVLLDPIGYVLVSGDSDVRPVIAYSFDSNLDTRPSPENFPLAIFLLDAQNRIAAASTRPRSVVRRNNELWRRYIEGAPSLFDEYTSATVFGPYIDTQWNQGDPYNMFCPIDPETGARCPIGCVVTAMGQIVNYWEWPPSITFDTTDSYISDATTPTIFIDAPTANMDTVDYNSDGTDPDDTTIAHLLFACGVAIHVQYQDGGSMATSPAVSTALLGHFGYLSADDIMPSSPTFYTEMVIDVMARRVSYMSMHSPDVGHGVVVDGYRESGEFHVNYGWGGTADAWYFLPESLVAGINIVDYGIVNIVPPVITHMPVENLAGDALTGGHVMLHWDAPLNITEPVIHYNIYRSTMSAPFELLGSTHGLNFMDRYPPELGLFTYAVGAVYRNDVESRRVSVDVFTEIHDGWNRIIEIDGDETPFDVASNGAGGFVAVGSRETVDGLDLFLVNIGISGDTIWTRIFGGDGDDCGYSIERTADGGYIVAGETESFGAGGSDVWLLKLDSDGDTSWTTTYGGPDDEGAHDVILTSSGGYLITGYTITATEDDMSLIKVDASGAVEWTKNFAGLAGYSAFEATGGGYYVGGFHLTGPLGNHDAMLMKTDSSGDSIWTRAYGGVSLDEIYSMVPTADGAVMAGVTRSYGIPMFTSAYIVKVDFDGDTIWTRHYGGMSDFSANCVAALNSGFLTIGSVTNSGNKDVYLLYMDANGDTLKSHIYGTSATDIGYAALPLPDSSLAIAGRTYSDSTNNFWLMKVGGPVSPVAEAVPQKPASMSIFAYPNPFNSAVTIVFDYESESRSGEQVGRGAAAGVGASDARTGQVGIEIFDISGRLIADLPVTTCDESQVVPTPAIWQPAESVGSGVYLIRARVGDNNITKRIVYLK